MAESASDLAARLAHDAEAVCREYLSSGHKSGRYWIVGDVRNTKGRSMFVRLTGPETGKGGRANGPTPQQVSMAICSMSSAKAAVLQSSETWSTRHGGLSACRVPSRSRHHRPDASRPHHRVHRSRRNGYSRWRSRLWAHARNRISVSAALRRCTEPDRCDFIRAATIAPTSTARQRPGPR